MLKITGKLVFPSGRILLFEDDITNKKGQVSYSWKTGKETGKYRIILNVGATDFLSKEDIERSFQVKSS